MQVLSAVVKLRVPCGQGTGVAQFACAGVRARGLSLSPPERRDSERPSPVVTNRVTELNTGPARSTSGSSHTLATTEWARGMSNQEDAARWALGLQRLRGGLASTGYN